MKSDDFSSCVLNPKIGYLALKDAIFVKIRYKYVFKFIMKIT